MPACAILGKTQRQSQITAIQRTQIVLIWIDSMILAVIFQPKWFSDSVLQFHTAVASSSDEAFAWSPGWLGVLLAHRPFQPWGHGIGIFWEGNLPSHLGLTPTCSICLAWPPFPAWWANVSPGCGWFGVTGVGTASRLLLIWWTVCFSVSSVPSLQLPQNLSNFSFWDLYLL